VPNSTATIAAAEDVECERASAFGCDQPSELAAPGHQHNAGGNTGQRAAGQAGQGLAQPDDEDLQAGAGRCRRLLRPQDVDQVIHQHDLPGRQRQAGQQQTHLRPGRTEPAIAGPDLHRAEHPQPYAKLIEFGAWVDEMPRHRTQAGRHVVRRPTAARTPHGHAPCHS
jgi:hypothetical protein